MFSELTTTHKINIGLYAVAFLLFVANQFAVLAGWVLDLRGPLGAGVLTAFLACGVLVQFAKLFEGHDRWYEYVLTIGLLGAHIYAEITIWDRTQIQHVGLPGELPLYIVGLYWVVGAGDLFILTLRHNVQRLRGEFRTRAELEQELALAQQQQSAGTAAQNAALVRGTCPDCDAVFERTTALGVQNALNAHARWCPGPGTVPQPSSNGHRAHVEEES